MGDSGARRGFLLYSGGLDSLTSLIQHREQVRALISVWGADVEVEDASLWADIEKITAAAPAMPGIRHITARTNMRRIIDELRPEPATSTAGSTTPTGGAALTTGSASQRSSLQSHAPST